MTPPFCEIQLAYKLLEVTKRMEEYKAGAKSASGKQLKGTTGRGTYSFIFSQRSHVRQFLLV